MAGRRLSEKKFKSTSIGLTLVLLFCGWVAAQEFAWYCRPSGSINYRGAPAQEGLLVSALIGGVEYGNCLTTSDGTYELTIPQDDLYTSKKEGWAEGDTITVKVGGFNAIPSFPAFSGSKTINLYLPSLDVKLTTWGKIKALFK